MKNIIALFTLLLLVGCSSQPRQVVASRALVDHVVPSSYQPIPQDYWQALESTNTTSVQHEQGEIQIKTNFISALGHSCRNLYFTEQKVKNLSHRIACKIESSAQQQENNQQQDTNKEQWYLMPAIVEGNEVTF